MICSNCGRPINKTTLVCEYCGSDYNEYSAEPICDHVYNEYFLDMSPRNLNVNLHLKCEKCGEIVDLHITQGLIRDLTGRYYV